MCVSWNHFALHLKWTQLLLFSCSVMSDSLLWPHGLQHARLPCPSLSPTFCSIESMMPSNHLIRCCPLLLLPSVFPNIRVFSSESAHRIRWPKYWSFSPASVLPMNVQGWFPLGLTGLINMIIRQLKNIYIYNWHTLPLIHLKWGIVFSIFRIMPVITAVNFRTQEKILMSTNSHSSFPPKPPIVCAISTTK